MSPIVRPLPAPVPSTEDRLAAIEDRIDVLCDGVREILADLAALKVRFGIDR